MGAMSHPQTSSDHLMPFSVSLSDHIATQPGHCLHVDLNRERIWSLFYLIQYSRLHRRFYDGSEGSCEAYPVNILQYQCSKFRFKLPDSLQTICELGRVYRVPY